MKQIQILFILFLISLASFAQELPEPMNPKRMVNDFTKMFNPQELSALEQKLRQFNDSSSTQIAIATVTTLDRYSANDYAQRLAEKWKIGQAGKDNGILILVKPKNGREKGEIAIAVGYGLEGVVPDAIASRIIRNEAIPEFQKGNYYNGINKAANVLMDLTKGEYTATQYAKKAKGGNWLAILIPFTIFFLFPIFIRRRRGYTAGNGSNSTASSASPFFIGGLGGLGSSRGFGSFSSGSGSFGGFGGGSFGGGGASGSW